MSQLFQNFRGVFKELTKWCFWCIKLRSIDKQNPILIYQMGKVGSRTVYTTLKESNTKIPILHIHTLNEDIWRNTVKHTRRSPKFYLPEHLIVSWFLMRKLKKGIFPCRIITLTREPIGRAISFLFQDLNKKAYRFIHLSSEKKLPYLQLKLTEMLMENNGHSNPGEWFEKELKVCFNIDVFEKEYNFEKGFQIIDHVNTPVLIMRMEDINFALNSALSNFLTKGVWTSVKQANISNDKWYAEWINRLKSQYKLTPQQAQSIFSTYYFNHFYASFQNSLENRWVRP